MKEEPRLSEVLSQSPNDAAVRPKDLKLDRVAGLSVEWADGRTDHFPLSFLRKNCPCATCRTERETNGGGVSVAAGGSGGSARTGAGLSLTILPQGIDRAAQFTDAKLVGQYAIQITWGDGHNTGIYDFRYLRAIAPGRE